MRPCLSVCTFEDLTAYWNGESCPKHPAVHTESPDSSVCSVLGVSRGVAGCTSKGLLTPDLAGGVGVSILGRGCREKQSHAI